MIAESINSNRLFISKISQSNGAKIYNLLCRNRLFLSRWLIWVKFINSLEDELLAIEKMNLEWDKNKKYSFVIKGKEDDAIMGMITVIKIYKYRKRAEIGYWLGEEFNGNGFITEAVNAIENELFKIGIKQISIRCNEKNSKSIAVAKRNEYKYYFSKKEKEDKFIFYRKNIQINSIKKNKLFIK